MNSRRNAGEAISKKILRDQEHVAIFPSGTTRIQEDRPWKTGSFKIAETYKIPVQPFRLWFSPTRKSAYIDKDMLPLHMLRLLKAGQITAQLEFHEPVVIKNALQASREWKEWSSCSRFRDAVGTSPLAPQSLLNTGLKLQTTR